MDLWALTLQRLNESDFYTNVAHKLEIKETKTWFKTLLFYLHFLYDDIVLQIYQTLVTYKLSVHGMNTAILFRKKNAKQSFICLILIYECLKMKHLIVLHITLDINFHHFSSLPLNNMPDDFLRFSWKDTTKETRKQNNTDLIKVTVNLFDDFLRCCPHFLCQQDLYHSTTLTL